MVAAILEFVKQHDGSHLGICQTIWWQQSWNLSNNMMAAILKFVKQHDGSHLEICQTT